MTKVVLDTNTVISGIFWKGPPRRILDAAREGKVLLYRNASTDKELARVLAYRKFRLNDQEIAPLMAEIRSFSIPVAEVRDDSPITEDATDNVFIRCALDAGAPFIVSGDRHLLRLGRYEGLRIIRARLFVSRFSL